MFYLRPEQLQSISDDEGKMLHSESYLGNVMSLIQHFK